MRGSEISVVSIKTWQKVSTSECRLSMMIDLRRMNVGFGDMENFDLKLNSKFRSHFYKERVQNVGSQSKLVQEAMQIIIRDEEKYLNELYREKEKIRKEYGRIYKKNSRTYRRIMNELKNEANKISQEMNKKYKAKIEHLRKKYREEEKEKIKKLPKGLEDFSTLRVFDEDAFEQILVESYEVLIIGDLEIDEDEQNALKLPPKFSVMEDLLKGGMEFDQETAFAKIRMEIQREIDEDLQGDEEEADQGQDDDEEDEELRMKSDEIMAQARQPYDPVGGVYDDRRRRVTDLKECAKVTLPKPLPPQYEAALEMRRSAQEKIYNKYVETKCNKKGEQRSNLTRSEKEGIKKLAKRRKNMEIIIMNTDKSGRFVIATMEEYKKMGQDHISKDKPVTSTEIDLIEKQLNGHCIAWAKMNNSGENWNHMSRIMESKTSKSRNTAKMRLLYKDHKAVPRKTRPLVTGNTSDTLGLSNTVSEVIEAVANNSKDAHELVSTEDLLAKTKKYNQKAEERSKRWERDRIRKIKCRKCQFEKILFDMELNTPPTHTPLSQGQGQGKGQGRLDEMRLSLATPELRVAELSQDQNDKQDKTLSDLKHPTDMELNTPPTHTPLSQGQGQGKG